MTSERSSRLPTTLEIDYLLHPPLLERSPALRGPISWSWLLEANKLGRACVVEALQILVDREHPGLEPLSGASETTRTRAQKKLLKHGLFITKRSGAIVPNGHEPERRGRKKVDWFLQGPLDIEWLRTVSRAPGQTLMASLFLILEYDLRKKSPAVLRDYLDRLEFRPRAPKTRAIRSGSAPRRWTSGSTS